MLNKRILFALCLFAFSCGGGGGETSGAGGSVSGFYSLSLSLNQRDITSPAVAGAPPNLSIPADTISGTLALSYSGTLSTPLKGTVKKAQVCLEGFSCYSLPISGVLTANANPLSFSLSVNSYKLGLPWIAVNPYEDRILSTTVQSVSLTSGGTSRTQTDNYFNSTRNLALQYPPVAKNSLLLAATGEWNASSVYSGYTTASGIASVNLPRGTVSTNQIKPSSVKLVAGSLKCKDDGSGNITDDTGTPPGTCSGSINYASGVLQFQINGVSSATDVSITYTVQGTQTCLDDGSGSLAGDCTGSINYSTGSLSYKFSNNFSSVPVPVAISYTQASASGNTITYALPPTTPTGTYTYQVAGRVVEVRQGTTLLCSNQGVSGVCSVSVNNGVVSINFPNGVLPNLTLNYSVDTKVDMNPAIDTSVYGGQYGGSTTPTVSGYVEVEVALESGETLRARASITFRVVPQ